MLKFYCKYFFLNVKEKKNTHLEKDALFKRPAVKTEVLICMKKFSFSSLKAYIFSQNLQFYNGA